MDAESSIVLSLVIGIRLLLPLTIPYFPLTGVLACLLIDMVDLTIFKHLPAIDVGGYQSYDKALDTYYLTITYVSTFRNWTNWAAFRVGQALFYYRLVGVLAFELSQARVLLLVFPNTFEYFFIAGELVRLRWAGMRVNRRAAIAAATLLWVLVKLPQEYWIHIAKIDTTAFIAAHWQVLLVFGTAVLAALWWIMVHKAPAADHRLRFHADPLPPPLKGGELYRALRAHAHVLDVALLEKTALVAMVTIIFTQLFRAELRASTLQIAFAVAVFVILNAFVSQWLARRGRSWRSAALELCAMGFVNLGLVSALELVGRSFGPRDYSVPFVATLFFVYLATLIVVLFDRYRIVAMVSGFLRQCGELDRGGEIRPGPTEAGILCRPRFR